MRNQSLLKPLEIEIPTVAKQLGAMALVADVQRIPAEQMQQLGERLRTPPRDTRREYTRGPDQTLPLQSREQVRIGGTRVREKEGEAEGKEVGRVARVGEEVPRNLELAMADGHEQGFLVELGDEFGEGVELCVGEEAHEVLTAARRDVVALKVQGNIAEGGGITVYVEGVNGGGGIGAVSFGLGELAAEVLGKVGGC